MNMWAGQNCIKCGYGIPFGGRCMVCWPIVAPPEPLLTPDTVRRIVREEIEKALAKKEAEVWKPPFSFERLG